MSTYWSVIIILVICCQYTHIFSFAGKNYHLYILAFWC